MTEDKPDNTQAVRQTNQSFFFQIRHLPRRPSDCSPRATWWRGARASPRHPGVPRLRRAGGGRRPLRDGCGRGRGAHRRGCRAAGALQPPGRPLHRRPGDLDRPHDRLDRRAGDPRHRRRPAGPAAEGRDRRARRAGCGAARDEATAAYWRERTAAYHGIVTWSPTIDPERLKLRQPGAGAGERRATAAARPGLPRRSCEDGAVAGVVFESKEGRLAIRAARDGGLHRRRRHLRARRRGRRHRHRGARHPSLHEHRPGSGAAAT